MQCICLFIFEVYLHGPMWEPDMYFVDTKNVIRILDVEIIGPHNYERRNFTDNKS